MSIPRPGSTLDRYRVEETIGSGSMGDVVRAVDVDLRRPVAIKVLSEKHRDNAELRARFVREGQAVAAISHPNVVQVFTTGTFDGRPYIAMELLKGVDLGTVVKEQGVMGSLTAARALLDAARGLDAAARAGLIHRDVKPSNLVLTEAGLVKVTDFGLAKPINPGNEPALTAMGVVVGTPDYIAPEQARGEAIDERVDIYALGGTLYFLLTGSPPFRTGNPADDKYLKVVARHLKEPAPDARQRNRFADDELAVLGCRMMAKKPGDRPGYRELLERLTHVVERLQRGSTEAPPRVQAGPVSPEPTPFLGRLGTEPGDARARARTAVDSGRRSATRPPPSGARASESASPAESSIELPAAGPARWLIGLTALSALVFAVGLALYLFGPRPAPARAAAPPDAGVAAAPSAPPPPPIAPPPDALVLTGADGAPRLFVDKRPVSLGEFAAAFPDKKQPDKAKKKNAAPVVDVAYADAEAYASKLGKRLLRPEEWLAAEKLPGWTAAGATFEWVDDGTRGSQARRQVRAAGGASERRPPRAQPNVTFRLALEPGAAAAGPAPAPGR